MGTVLPQDVDAIMYSRCNLRSLGGRNKAN